METRLSRKRKESLPGGDRRGASGAGAGCHSMRSVSGSESSRRAPTDKNVTADLSLSLPSSSSSLPSSSSSPKSLFSSLPSSPPSYIDHLSLGAIAESLETPLAEDASQAASALRPATTKAGKPRVRMKWDSDINIFIMRTYYTITNLETNLTAHRQLLHQKFIQQYPNTNVTVQRVSEQRKFIVDKGYLSEDILNKIKADVVKSLQESNNSITPSPRHAVNTTSNRLQQTSQTITTPNNTESQTPPDSIVFSDTFQSLNNTTNIASQVEQNIDHNLVQELSNQFELNIINYNGIDPSLRPTLPKTKPSKKLTFLTSIINRTLIPLKLSTLETLTDTQTLIYCAAKTVLDSLKIKINRPNNKTRLTKPSWQIRIENDVESFRRDIGRLTQFKNGNRGKKLVKRVNEMLNDNKVHGAHGDINRKVIEHIDTLKQKLAVKSHRLARYKKAQERKDNNKLFTTNEKLFYRKLRGTSIEVGQTPSKTDLTDFWSSIWSHTVEHNSQAEWIVKENERMKSVEEMEFESINVEELQDVINRTLNWKAAGIDGVHNYWIKKLNSLHKTLAQQITDIIKGNAVLPQFLTKGITYMLPKTSRTDDPSQYRPITCLPTLYKIITGCISKIIYRHVDINNILAEEQKGCRRYHMGCKEQLTIDSVILKHIQTARKDLFITYIDYKKAFDSVPHSLLIQILEIYKVQPHIIKFLKATMASWRTTVNLRTANNDIITDEIPIKRGIFQGDSLSPLWFCLALNPLSHELIDSKLGFNVKINRQIACQLTHLLYMDDLKLYADTEEHMTGLLNITTQFSNDINMDFGLDKCKKLNIKKGKIAPGSYQINENLQIDAMEPNELYKYLGYNQSRQIHHISIKQRLKTEFINRVYSLCKSSLNSKNLFKSINTFAIPVLTYSFGVIKWTKTDLQTLQIKIRTTLTQYRYHHPKSAIERTTIARKDGGRGMIDLTLLHTNQVFKLKYFFNSKAPSSLLHDTVCKIDKNFTPLNLSDSNLEPIDDMQHYLDKCHSWNSKELHGRHPSDLNQPYVDKIASNKWLECAGLFPETEGFIIAIQDQVINTRNFRKYIIKDRTITSDLCRKCHSKPETIQHITGACITLTQNDYTHRHNQLANIVHQKIAYKYSLIHGPPLAYYKYTPQAVLENTTHKLYYDRTILTDHTIYNNRPDITLLDKQRKKAYIIDIAVPNTNNIQTTITEKIRKYTELQEEIRRMWKLDSVSIVPIVISTTGIIPRALHNALNILDLPKFTYLTLQKAAILNTCRIVRKFLQLTSDSEANSTETHTTALSQNIHSLSHTDHPNLD